MISVVVPVKNEETGIAKTLDNCLNLPVNEVIIVLNGCTDNSHEIIKNHPLLKKFEILLFTQPLGIDIPRAVGAAYAYSKNCSGVLFLDGDMQGNISSQLGELITAVTQEDVDMALTDCYPYLSTRTSIANTVLEYREKLNKTLGLIKELGAANPCHGPHAVSRRALETIPWRAFAIPPLSLAMAVENQLKVKIATSIPHNMLLSPLRNDDHSIYIAETIIGDCLEAICHIKGLPPSREDNGIYYLGYHPERKFGVLEEFVRGLGLLY